MKPDTTSFRVCWKASGHRAENRVFTDADLALEFYSGVAHDPHTTEAKLVENIERELRFFERERSNCTAANAKT